MDSIPDCGADGPSSIPSEGILDFLFCSFFKLNRFSFLFFKDTLVYIECEAVCRPWLPIF